jgi:hypothetical protein
MLPTRPCLVNETLTGQAVSMRELAELDELRAARAALDIRELELIDRARHQGATWAQLAAVLGVTSRQAAEQRRQRLSAAAHRAAQNQDPRYGPSIVQLRAAIDDLRRRIAADAIWDARFVRAALVRETVAAAVDATPGALFALAAQVAADLAAAAVTDPPRPLRDAVHALYAAVRTAVNESLT